jgi:hypothetical protein
MNKSAMIFSDLLDDMVARGEAEKKLPWATALAD